MSKDLGKSTSYAYYVAEGGTKTPQEYGEMLVNIDTVATRAEDAADSAAESATGALNSKNAAQTAATTATNKASEATTAATTATTKAGEASTSASTATSAKDTAVSASQTATTKATEATTAAATATSAATTATTAKDDAVSAKTAAQTAQTGAETAAASVQSSAEQIATNTEDIAQLKSDLTTKADATDMLKAFPTDTASGSVASFADGANVPVKSLIVNIDPVQSGSGDPSPDNVRPISGHDEVNVQRTGKNLFDGTLLNGYYDANNGGVFVSSGNWKATNKMRCKSSTTYVMSGTSYPGGSYNGRSLFWDMNGNYLGARETGANFTSYANSAYMAFYFGITYVTDAIQIEEGTTATTYEPYSGQSITIPIGQTVYGGKLDVVSGVLTTYPYYASYNGETLTGAWISDRDKYVSGATPTTGAQVVNIGGAGTDVQLTPHEVRSLLGSNNVWADTGDTEITYRADPTLYIQRLTEPDADMVADANITSGQYFMVGNTLYKATANIASGATISPNVNCTRKSLSEALNELNA